VSAASLRSARPARATVWAALLAILLVGAALRFYRADHQEIWGDEGAKLEVVNQDLAHLFWPGAEVHPRFFHAWLFVWFRLVGYTPYALRGLPVLFGVLGLPLVYALARRLLRSRAAGLGAAGVLALNPFHVSYSQDLTMYSLLFAILCLSGYALVRALRAPKFSRRLWALYALTTLLAVHTHYYAAFVVVAHGLFVLLAQRRALPAWVGAQLVVAAGFLPWAGQHYQLLAGQAVDQVQDFSLANLGRIVGQGALGFTVGSTLPGGAVWLGWVFALAAVAVLVLLLVRPATRWAGALLALWLAVPPLLVWVFDIWLQHFGERFVSMSLPPLLVLLGAIAAPELWSINRAHWQRLVAAGLAIAYLATSAASLRAWYTDPAFLKSHYGEMLAFIAARAQPGDVLLLDGPQQAILYQIYAPPGLDHRFIPSGSVLTAEAADRDLPALVAGYNRAWLVLYGAPAGYDPDHQAEVWLGRHGYKALYQSYLGNYVTLYALGQQVTPPLTASGAQFTNGPRLVGYAFEPSEAAPGDVIYLTLQWSTDAALTTDYTVFTHLLWPDGQLLAGSDSQPVSGTRPTTTWAPGELILDRYALLIPPDTPPGAYAVQIGLYDLLTSARLTLAQPGAPDHLILGTIRVRP